MSKTSIKRVLGLAFVITYLSVGHASSGSIQSIRCSIVNMKMTIMEDGHTQKINLSRAQIKAIVSESPQECRTTVYKYGNGVLDMVDAPNKCASIVAELNVIDIPPLFPVEYKVRGQKLTFRKKQKILDPKFGAANVSSSGTFNIDQMTLQFDSKLTIRGQNGSVNMKSFLHCN